jgi:hypothetical protein
MTMAVLKGGRLHGGVLGVRIKLSAVLVAF